MVKRKGRRKFRRYVRGQVNERMALGTLAGQTLIGAQYDESVNERTFVSSLVAVHSLQGMSISADDGPIMVGVAHSDYTDAEVEAFIENAASWNEGDLVGQEIGKRKVKIIGIFPSSGAVDANLPQLLNAGRLIRTKLKWILLQGQSLRQWAYNVGTSALATTDPIYDVEGHVNLWPQ